MKGFLYHTGSFLYVATTRDIYLFDVGNNSNNKKEATMKPLLLDHLGCERGLWTPTAPNYADAHFITGQKDALYFYNPEGRGQCYVFEVRLFYQKQLHVFFWGWGRVRGLLHAY